MEIQVMECPVTSERCMGYKGLRISDANCCGMCNNNAWKVVETFDVSIESMSRVLARACDEAPADS